MSKTIIFLDLDGVVVVPGTHQLLPGALEALHRLESKGELWVFSSWAFNESDRQFLQGLNVTFSGIIPKPVADEYIVIDDRLNREGCSTSLPQVQ